MKIYLLFLLYKIKINLKSELFNTNCEVKINNICNNIFHNTLDINVKIANNVPKKK